MTWRPPNDLERFLLADTRDRWPELIPLARLLVLAPRIEPLLLRNARRRFLPGAGAELESQLWFCPLVAGRSTREIVLHLGIARVLALQLGGSHPCPDDPLPDCDSNGAAPPELTEVWAFTCDHTRHWPAEDRLERDLRYHALRGDDAALAGELRAILARIAAESEQGGDESRRIGLSRLAKRTLPTIRPGLGNRSSETARLLARYAALALGDAGDWSADSQPGAPEALPTWLNARLPPPLARARLGVEIRWDDTHGQALHLVDAPEGGPAIALPSPLPGRLHVAPGGQAGDWHAVTRGTRIPISPATAVLRLTTLDGCQWDLVTDALPEGAKGDSRPQPLLLVHVEADRAQAGAIAKWLRGQGVPVELLTEAQPGRGAAAEQVQARSAPPRSVRLWTRAARDLWAHAGAEPPEDLAQGLLLRIEPVDPPSAGAAAGRLLDWQDWQRLADSPQAAALLQALGRWWREGEIPGPGSAPFSQQSTPATGPVSSVPPAESAGLTVADTDWITETERPLGEVAEIMHMLAEIANPQTEPPRRLVIGDRLAELGDPRPGVGTVEIEVPVDEAVPAEAPPVEPPTQVVQPAPAYSPEIQALLDEIADPKTTPPRRLEIGDELDKLGDPRPGVGLRPNGLPDIDWVKVHSGPFIYQDGETRELPDFWIGRYPVTNAQYQAFIDDGGYGNLPKDRRGNDPSLGRTADGNDLHLGDNQQPERDWWRDLKRSKAAKPSWTQGNRPRTDVDWYEAVAFTRWLNARLGLPDGTLRLPTELEWEKAARGAQGLEYPWGQGYRAGYANVDERGAGVGDWYLAQTTAVGLYPQGRSPYGVEDLAGTVWEWCLNKHEDLGAIAPDSSGASRAVRGGSWNYYPVDARAASRSWSLPGGRLGYFRGFRLLSSVPIAPVR